MLPFKRILCPTDFSEPSYEALQVASELALYFRAELTLIHVIPISSVIVTPVEGAGAGSPPVNVPEFARESERNTEKVLAEEAHARVPPDVVLHLMVAHGDPANEILTAAEKIDADMVIIATHGRTGWRRFIFGSVAEKVVRCAVCPVLTIHEGKQAGISSAEETGASIEA